MYVRLRQSGKLDAQDPRGREERMTDEKKIKDEELANITGAGVADIPGNKPEEGSGGSGGTSTAEGGGGENPLDIAEN
jgi:hypothetical protein